MQDPKLFKHKGPHDTAREINVWARLPIKEINIAQNLSNLFVRVHNIREEGEYLFSYIFFYIMNSCYKSL